MAEAKENIPETVTSFLELESMASMQRIGDSMGAEMFTVGGSTLVDLEGISTDAAKKASDAKRDELSHGQHSSERYKVLHEIARGGMGAVLEVHDSDLDRRVAMKVLLRDTRRSETDSGNPMETGPVNRFIAEAQLTGSLEHPNIVPVHELGLDSEGRVYFTMKRVKGRSLRQILDKLRQGHALTMNQFPLGRLLTILLKICDAIELAHSRRILHRDLKPENIMVGEFGEVLVMDWGLAKQVDISTQTLPDSDSTKAKIPSHVFRLETSLGATDSSEVTREGTVSGTPAYMSPEQAAGKVGEMSERTDIFCLGAMLYEMLCLCPPFLAARMIEALDQAREHKLLAPRQKLESVLRDERLKKAFGADGIARARKHPAELVAIAMHAMDKEKMRRYHSVADFKKDIENYLSDQPVTAYRDNPIKAIGKWARRNPTRASVATLAVIFLLMGGMIAIGAMAKVESDRAEQSEKIRLAQTEKTEEVQRRLEAEARERREAQRAAKIDKERADAERREKERVQRRQEAFVPYSQAADMRVRASTFEEWDRRAEVWKRAVPLYLSAIEKDPTFVEAHLEVARVYADLGLIDDALIYFALADNLTVEQTGRGNVEALMAYAMYDIERYVLTNGMDAAFILLLNRFEPVRVAAEPDSKYAKLAGILLNLLEISRSRSVQEFNQAMSRVPKQLSELDQGGLPMWELYALLALLDNRASSRVSVPGATDYLELARRLKPNLPLLVWIEIRNSNQSERDRIEWGIARWGAFIDEFSYDARGWYSRARLRFNSKDFHDSIEERSDLEAAIRANPHYAEAHTMLLRVHARENNKGAYRRHLDSMRGPSSRIPAMVVDRVEAELSAQTGQFDRVNQLVSAGLRRDPNEGIEIFTIAAHTLLDNLEYDELVNLCGVAMREMTDEPPAIVKLYYARGLTMQGRFDAAVEQFVELESTPQVFTSEQLDVLRNWGDSARKLPGLIGSASLPDSKYRYDLGRILGVAGSGPIIRWLQLLGESVTVGRRDLLKLELAADYVLKAKGYAQLASVGRAEDARRNYSLAVDCLKFAMETGYLNRNEILSDDLLSPLTQDPRIQHWFNIQ